MSEQAKDDDSTDAHAQPAPVDLATAARAISDGFAAAIESIGEAVRRAFQATAALFAPKPLPKVGDMEAMLDRGRYRGTKKRAKAVRRWARAIRGMK